MKKPQTARRVMLVTMNGDSPTTGFAVRTLLIAKSLNNAGVKVTLLRLYPALKSQGTWKKEALLGIKLLEIPILPTSRFPFLRFLSYLIANPVIHFIAKLKRIDIIQAEAHEAGLAALKFRPTKKPIVVDFHGAATEESIGSKESQIRRSNNNPHWLDTAEILCISRADQLLVVSQEMIDHLKSKHKLNDVNKFNIAPINVESSFFITQSKEAARKNLGLEKNHLVFVYSGGAQRYQCIEEMALTFLHIRKSNDRARLLIISTQLSEFESIFKSIFNEYINEIIYISTEKNLVPRFLAAADAAFLLRRNEILNIVSCPTKFGEYLSSGLPVITTEWAGHAPAIVENNNVGLIVDFDYKNSASKIIAYCGILTNEISDRCRATADAGMRWEVSEKIIFSCHDRLSGRN